MTTQLFKPESIHSLSGVEPNLPIDDLTILGEIVPNAKVVGLGEPTHGQKEINQLRDRMTRYLIEHQGFRVVAMEDSAIRCRIVNDFIIHGRGTAVGALTSQNFWTWKTREVLAMIEWLRGWNIDHPDDPVRFIGIDIQDIATPATELIKILPLIGVNLSSAFETRLKAISSISMWGDDPFQEQEYRSDMLMIKDIQYAIENTANSNELTLDLPKDCALSIEQSLKLWREIKLSPPVGNADRWNRRDEVMAARALAPTLDGGRVILWAHNGHVQSEKPTGIPEGSVTLGERLRHGLKREYLVFSGVFGSGAYRARNPNDGAFCTIDVGDPPANTIDHELSTTQDGPALIVDLQSPGTILFEPQTTRWAGAALASSDEMIANVRPALGSNAIAFVREATPSERV